MPVSRTTYHLISAEFFQIFHTSSKPKQLIYRRKFLQTFETCYLVRAYGLDRTATGSFRADIKQERHWCRGARFRIECLDSANKIAVINYTKDRSSILLTLLLHNVNACDNSQTTDIVSATEGE